MSNRVSRVITQAYRLIKRGWVQGYAAVSMCGHEVATDSLHAAKWCLLGAVMRAVNDLKETKEVEKQALRELRKTIKKRQITLWNDASSRTHEEILTVLRRTWARLKKEENLP